MISRHWRGVANVSRADDYLAHLREDTLPALRRIPGFLGARILRRPLEQGVEFLVITEWSSMVAIEAFAGPDPEQAVVPADARASLLEFDQEVRHYEPVPQEYEHLSVSNM